MAFESTESFYKVESEEIAAGPFARPDYGPNSPDSRLAEDGYYRLHVDDGGVQPSRHWLKQYGAVLVDTPGQRCTRTDVWVERTPQEKRDVLSMEIENQRLSMDRSPIDLRADAGLNGLLDEANVSASEKRSELGNTSDAELDAFDTTLDPRAANSIQVAASLSQQERSVLAAANQFTEQQRTDLSIAATQHEAVVDAGDTQAAVPEVPSFARRMIGVLGEEYGTLSAKRVFVNPWYWLEVEFDLTRDLDAAEYFLAVYDETAPDDRDDTTAQYLSTAQFAVLSPGKLIATKEAINLQRALDFGYKLTICKGHLDFPQFDRVLFAGNLTYDEYRMRWNGLA